MWRWRNWSCTTYWSHHSSIRHNMHLLCPQRLLPPRQTGRSVHQVIEVFALLQFCNPTILQTCYAATVLQHIVTVYVLLQLIVRFQHVGIFPQYNVVAKIYVMHAAMCDFGSCRQVCRGKCEKWVMAIGMLCLHKTDGISYRVQYTYTSWSWSLVIWSFPFVQHFKPINDIKHLTYIVIRIRRLREVWCGGPIYPRSVKLS